MVFIKLAKSAFWASNNFPFWQRTHKSVHKQWFKRRAREKKKPILPSVYPSKRHLSRCLRWHLAVVHTAKTTTICSRNATQTTHFCANPKSMFASLGQFKPFLEVHSVLEKEWETEDRDTVCVRVLRVFAFVQVNMSLSGIIVSTSGLESLVILLYCCCKMRWFFVCSFCFIYLLFILRLFCLFLWVFFPFALAIRSRTNLNKSDCSAQYTLCCETNQRTWLFKEVLANRKCSKWEWNALNRNRTWKSASKYRQCSSKQFVVDSVSRTSFYAVYTMLCKWMRRKIIVIFFRLHLLFGVFLLLLFVVAGNWQLRWASWDFGGCFSSKLFKLRLSFCQLQQHSQCIANECEKK